MQTISQVKGYSLHHARGLTASSYEGRLSLGLKLHQKSAHLTVGQSQNIFTQIFHVEIETILEARQ